MIIDDFYSNHSIDDFETFSDYSKYYIANFVSQEDIKKQERSYIHDVSRTALFNENCQNIYKLVAEGRYYTWPSKTVKYMFFSEKRNSVAFEADERAKMTLEHIAKQEQINWKDYLICSELCASSEIVHKFKLAPWQLGLIEGITGDCIIDIIIPDIYNNVKNITDVMNLYGYFVQRKYERTDIGIKWVEIEFGMNIQRIINEMLEDCQYLYHIAPTKYDCKIDLYGLVPKSKNVLYSYPDRIYLFECENDVGQELKNLSINDFKQAIRFLYSEKEKSNNPYVDDSSFSVYRIDVHDILNKVNFHLDVSQNAIPLMGKGCMISIYTEDNISRKAIEKIFEIKLSI